MRILTRAMKMVLWLLLALCVGVGIGALALRYVVFSHFDVWRAPLERSLSRLVHAQVRIGGLQAEWQGVQPCLTIKQLAFYDRQGRLILEARRLVATLSWRTLSAWSPIFSDIHIDDPHAVVYSTVDGGLRVGDALVPTAFLSDLFNTPSSSSASPTFLDDAAPGLRWLLRQEALRIHNGRIDLHMPLYTGPIYHKATFFPGHALQQVWGYKEGFDQVWGRTRMPIGSDLELAGSCKEYSNCFVPLSKFSSADLPSSINGIHFALFSQGRRHQMGMQAQMEGGDWVSPVDMRLHFQHSFWTKAAKLKNWEGTGYVGVDALPLRVFNQLRVIPADLTDGALTTRNWFAFNKGHLRGVQGVLGMVGARLHTLNAQPEGSSLPSAQALLSNTAFPRLQSQPPLPGIEIPLLSLGYTLSYRPAKLGEQATSLPHVLPAVLPYSDQFAAHLNDLVIELGPKDNVQRFTSAQMKLAYQTPSRQQSGHLTIEGDTLDLDFVSTLIRRFVVDSAVAPSQKVSDLPAVSSVVSSEVSTQGAATPDAHQPVAFSSSSALRNLDIRGVLRNYLLDIECPSWAIANSQGGASFFAQNVPNVLRSGLHSAGGMRYQFKADFDHLTVLSIAKVPLGITNMSGRMDANEQGGSLTLDTHQGAISVPEGLSIPTTAFDVLKGDVEWALQPLQIGHLLKLKTTSLFFANQDGAGEINASYQKKLTLPAAFAPLVEQTKQIRLPAIKPPASAKAVLERFSRAQFKQEASPAISTEKANTHVHSTATVDKGVLDLSLRIDRALLARVPRYLPSSLDKGLRDYLTHALQGGFTKHASLEIHGALNDFPFGSADAPGVFSVRAPFYEGRFDPSVPVAAPTMPSTTASSSCIATGQAAKNVRATPAENTTNWPVLEGLQGVFEIDRDVLKLAVAQGHYQDVKLVEVQGTIAHVSKRADDFLIKIHAQGPLNTMLDYVKHSPIPAWTGHPKEWVSAQGPALLDLHLRLPRQGAMQVGVQGILTFLGNTVSTAQTPVLGAEAGARSKTTLNSGQIFANVLPPVTHLHGALHFTERSLVLKSVTAQWLGGELREEGEVYPDGSTKITLRGHAAVSALRVWLRDAKLCTSSCMQLMKRLHVTQDGRIPYQLAMQYSREGNATGELQADLANLALDWPEPFSKAVHKPMQLRISVQDIVTASQKKVPSDLSSTDSKAVNARPISNASTKRVRNKLDGLNKASTCNAIRGPDKRIDVELGPLVAAYRLRETGNLSASNPYCVVSGILRLEANRDTNTDTHRIFEAAYDPSKAISFEKSIALGPESPSTKARGTVSTTKSVFSSNHRQALILPEQGVVATVQADYLDIDAWHAVFDSLSATQSAKSKSVGSVTAQAVPFYWPTRLSARVRKVVAAQRAWHTVWLDMTSAQGTWKVAAMAREFAGQLEWTPAIPPLYASSRSDKPDNGVLKAHFLRLALPLTTDILPGTAQPVEASRHKTALNLIDSQSAVEVKTPSRFLQLKQGNTALKDWPLLDLKVDALKVGEKEIGQIAIVSRWATRNDQPEWQLEKLQITNSDATFHATGNWTPSASNAPPIAKPDAKNSDTGYSAFDFGLDIHHAGALFERLGIPKMLQGGGGKVEGQIQWRGMPERVAYDSLVGQIKLELSHGRLLKAEPGVANLLGAFSLQSLVHLLVLDFRYLPGRGLAFDHAQGSAVIKNGVAYTDDFTVSSTPARITLTGSADIANRQQNLLFTIQPAINAGSAVLAVAVVNPVLGLGSYIAQQVLSASLAHNFLLHYAVSGSWDAPIIERVHMDTLSPKMKMPQVEKPHPSPISIVKTQNYDK